MSKCTICEKIYVGPECPFCNKKKSIDEGEVTLDKLGWIDRDNLDFDMGQNIGTKIEIHGDFIQGDCLKVIRSNEIHSMKNIVENELKNENKIIDREMEIIQSRTRKEGELIAFDIFKTLNQLRGECENEEILTIKTTINILKEKIQDEKSREGMDFILGVLDTYYDPSCKLGESHKIRILELCNYIEEMYWTNLIHQKI